jgi:predicted nucleotidyltransferase
MQLEHYPIEKLQNEIRAIVRRHFGTQEYKLFFFGSRVAGNNNDRSDIDIGIEASEPIPLHIMGRIREEIEELPTLYTIQIVDFHRVSQQFRIIALEHVEQFVFNPSATESSP